MLLLALLLGAAARAADAAGQRGPQWLEGPALDRARALYSGGRFRAAAKELRRVVAHEPAHPTARFALVQALLGQEALDPALAAALDAVAAAPDAALPRVALGEVSLLLGDYERADRAFGEAIVRGPGVARARLGMAVSLSSRGRREEAREHLKRASELDRDDSAIVAALVGAATDNAERVALLRRHLELATHLDRIARRSLEARIRFLDELGEGGRCLPSTLAPPTAAGAAAAAAIGIELLDRSGLGGRPALALGANGKSPIKALLDTGASLVNLSESYARRAGVAKVEQESVNGIGAFGRRTVWIGRARTLELGDLRLDDCVVRIVPDRFLDGAARGADAIVGFTDLYPHFVVELDVAGRALRLEPYRPVAEAPEPAARPAAGEEGVSLPLRLFGDDVLVPARLGDLSTQLLLDSGSLRTLLARRTARTLGTTLPTSRRVVGFAGEARDVGVIRHLEVELGDLELALDEALVLDLDGYSLRTGHGVGGLLGHSLLERLRLRIDYRSATATVTASGEATSPPATTIQSRD